MPTSVLRLAYAQEQSEWVFPTEKARAHDASVTLIINGIYCTYLRYLIYTPTFTVTCYKIVFAQFVNI